MLSVVLTTSAAMRSLFVPILFGCLFACLLVHHTQRETDKSVVCELWTRALWCRRLSDVSGVVCGPCMAVCECAIHHTRMDGCMDGWSVLFVWTNGTGNKVCVCDGWMETWEVGMGCCSCACCVCGDVARVDWPTLSFLSSVCVMKALAVFVCFVCLLLGLLSCVCVRSCLCSACICSCSCC